MPRYDEAFKSNAIALLHEIRENGFTKIKGVKITSVRKLIEALNIGSETLYKWDKEISKPKRTVRKTTEKKPSAPKPEKKEKSDYDNAKLGERFYGWLGRTLEIKNFGRLSLRSLKFHIGKKLIEESGLNRTKKESDNNGK